MSVVKKEWTRLSVNRAARFAFGAIVAAGLMLEPVPTSSLMAAPLLDPSIPARTVPAPADDGRYQVALGFFERLFGGRKRGSSKSKKSKNQKGGKSAGTSKKRTAAASAPPPVQTVKKDADATVIAVFGDEMGQDIGSGLKDAFSQVPDVKIEIHAVGRTGLFHRPQKNPLNDLGTLAAKKPFSFAVVMTGFNDRIKSPAKKDEEGVETKPSFDFRADGWDVAYEREIDRVRQAFAGQQKPVYWVGLPPMNNKKMTDELLHLNDLVRDQLSGRQERYIDIWDAFANEEGEFTFRGPDLNGQMRRLRQKNGVRFNKAGRRKLAFFVEKLVIRALSQSVDVTALPDGLALADETALKEGRGSAQNIYVVRKASQDADKLLSPANLKLAAPVDESPEQTAPALRVDQFRWNATQ